MSIALSENLLFVIPSRQAGRSSYFNPYINDKDSIICNCSIMKINELNRNKSCYFPTDFKSLYPSSPFLLLPEERIPKRESMYRISNYYNIITPYNKLIKLIYVGKYPAINIIKNLPNNFHFYIKYKTERRRKNGYKTV